MRIKRETSGRGLTLAPAGGAERLWSAGDVRGGGGLAANDALEPESRLGATVGDGFSVCGSRGVARPCGVVTRRAERGVSPARAAPARRLAVKLNRTGQGAAPMSRIVRAVDNPTVPVLSELMNAVDAMPVATERRGTVQVISA